MEFLENNFADALNYFAKYDRRKMTDEEFRNIVLIEDIIETEEYYRYLTTLSGEEEEQEKNEENKFILSDFFSGTKNELKSEIRELLLFGNDDAATKEEQQEKHTTVNKKSYIMVFLVIYLAYINDIIWQNLPKRLENGLKERQIRYVKSIDKMLLDNFVGAKDELKELATACGILKGYDHPKKLLSSHYRRWVVTKATTVYTDNSSIKVILCACPDTRKSIATDIESSSRSGICSIS